MMVDAAGDRLAEPGVNSTPSVSMRISRPRSLTVVVTLSASPDDVVAFAKERLANFKVPRYVEVVDGLPRNLSGKVLKNQLRNS